MTNKQEQIEQKLSFLYERLEELEENSLTDSQINFLMNEIDDHRTELLKLQVKEYYEIIENEDD
jgi:nitrate/nitrite-specific signal transduction histidine kinase